jgi:Fe-S cluster biogenesis protein NfuA
MKFVCNKRLVNVSHEFKKIDETEHCNIAKVLFHHDFISEVYIDLNFISITIKEDYSWENHTMEIREFILSFIKDGNELIESKVDKAKSTFNSKDVKNLDEISLKISELIETQIKPAVASDGGNILFQSYDKNTQEVNVILQGACSGCPSSTITLKNGIETMLKNELPGKISNVVAING